MVGLSGSIWVDGTELHYISESGTERRETGVDYGFVAGLPGSIWIEGTQLTYIDSSQHKRMLPYATLSTVAGLDGSIWLDLEMVHYIAGGKETYWHTDTHTDSIVPNPNWNDYWTDNHSDVTFAGLTGPWYADYDKSTGGVHIDNWSHTDHADEATAYFGHNDFYTDTDTHWDNIDTDIPPHLNEYIYQINSVFSWANHTDHTDHSNVAHADTPL